VDNFQLMDLMTGYQQAAVIAAGVRLGVFNALAETPPVSATVLATRLGTAPAPTAALLAALERLELVSSGDGHALTPAGTALCGRNGLALVSLKEAFFARVWNDLDATIRTGTPRLTSWAERLVTDPEQCRFFLRALRVIAEVTGPNLVTTPVFAPGRRLLDAGGGLGSYAVPLARAGALVTLAELPTVAAWAAEELAGVDTGAGTVQILAEDIFAAPLVTGFEAVLVSHVLHDLDDDDAVAFLRGARARVLPGSPLTVFELAGDSPGTIGPLFDLMMQVEGPGRARTAIELIELIERAGWGQARELPGNRPHVLVQAVS
jgi:hypothetical protein